MPICIKDPETERLARELAAVTGESLTEAIRIALAERLERLKRPDRRYPMREAARRIQERLAALPAVDPLVTNELAYDEHGLPT